jgi:glycosyltransferase involved in cell wall biosynthesis
LSGSREAYSLSDMDFAAIPAQEVCARSLLDEPIVSVLMLAWNHAEFIDEAIESVVTQQCDFPVELIIGEDCSDDETLSRCRDWQEKFPGIIRIVTAEENVGMHRNFSRIWHCAQGEFIALCEGDDYWVEPTKLQQQVDWLRNHPGSSLVGTFTDRISVNPAGEWMVSGRLGPLEIKEVYDLRDLVQSYSFHFSSVMLRKDSVQFPRWFWDVYCVDRPLYLLAAQNGSGGLLPIVTSRYRQHPGGVWSPRKPLDRGAASSDLFSKLESHLGSSYSATCRQTLARILWSYMAEAVEAGDRLAARKLFWQSLRIRPFNIFHQQGHSVFAAALRIHLPALYRALGGSDIREAKV